MASENDTTENTLVPDVDDATSEATEEFVVVDSKDVPESPTASATEPAPRKTAKVVVGESEDDDDDETIPLGEDNDFLADYPDDTEARPELELVHSRITSCTPLNLPRFSQHLKKICLRQNFISMLEPDDFKPLNELDELDLYDNKIKDVGQALDTLSKLTVLDLSFNLLKVIPGSLASLTSIQTIYFVQNKISRIQNLNAVGSTLQSLELGGNRIRTIENLDSLVNLRELWLGKNKIMKLQNLGSLRRLRVLSIQSNRLTRIEGLEELVELEELYLSHNGIEKLEGLEKNVKLRTLDAGNNRIQALENISHLTYLEELWLNDNAIPNLRDVQQQLAHLKHLQTVYLEGNPCQKNDVSNYRRKLIIDLPQISQIDATYVIFPIHITGRFLKVPPSFVKR
ncbi:hypothetical protein JB92DRAFT_2727299 [Gautieria morchelliformis]|nr:hypothetical protein JB92DRAFT_2727299 [Gautieria morchelliformis]